MEVYAHAVLTRQQAQEALDQVERELNACWEDLRQQLARGCSANMAAQSCNYQRLLGQRRFERLSDIETAERRVKAALQGMFHARRRREIVDKCFERQRARHLREQARGEQKFLDDLAGRRGSSILTWKATETPL